MCGIIGIVSDRVIGREQALTQKMLASIRHRGPDCLGAWESSNALLGAVRLSIIDQSAGPQPIMNEDETLILVCNGEIFNYLELRASLQEKGHTFRTRTDVEVLVHLYEEYGLELLDKVHGQFAFAIYDTRNKKLLVGRDRTGISPLFYCEVGSQFIFASEVKALFELSDVPRRFSMENISLSLGTWTVPAPETIYEGIYQVEPGTLIEVQNTKKTVTRYWSLDFSEKAISFTDATVGLREALERSVRRNLVADVPVGLYLSGGVDSSILAGLIAMNGVTNLNSYSVSFTDDKFDESSFQKAVAQRWGINHTELSVSGSDIAVHFPAAVRHAETILFRTAPVPLFLLSQKVNQSGHKVVLSGEGADEVFWGYDTCRELLLRLMWSRNKDSTWRPERFRQIFPYFKAYQESRGLSLLKKFYAADRDDVDDPYYSLRPRWRANSSLSGFLSSEFSDNIDVATSMNRISPCLKKELLNLDQFQRYQFLEMRGLLAGYLLSSQGDRMLMAHSVEGRPAFLDKEVIEFAATLPNRFKCRGLKDKFILRETFRDIIPEAVYKRPKFAYRAPDAASFFPTESKPDYVGHYMSTEVVSKVGIFDAEKVEGLFKKLSTRGAANASNRDNMAVTSILSAHILADEFNLTA